MELRKFIPSQQNLQPTGDGMRAGMGVFSESGGFCTQSALSAGQHSAGPSGGQSRDAQTPVIGGPEADWKLVPRQRRTVLVVEPEDAWRRKQCYALQKMGHQAAGVASVSAALLHIHKQVPELLLADLNLPNRGVEQLFKHVRDDDASSYVPFLFTCRGGHPLEIVKGVPLETRLVLKKPYTVKKCQEHVTSLLRRLDLIDGFGRLDAFSGRFRELDLYDLLGLITRYERTGILTLFSADRRQQASTRFHRGQLISARSGWMSGPDVIMELMLWDEAFFEFRPSDGLQPPVRGMDKAQLEELASSLALVDRSRLNPFPRSRTRTGETVVSHITADASEALSLTDVVHSEVSDSVEPLLEVVTGQEGEASSQEHTMDLPPQDVLLASGPFTPADFGVASGPASDADAGADPGAGSGAKGGAESGAGAGADLGAGPDTDFGAADLTPADLLVLDVVRGAGDLTPAEPLLPEAVLTVREGEAPEDLDADDVLIPDTTDELALADAIVPVEPARPPVPPPRPPERAPGERSPSGRLITSKAFFDELEHDEPIYHEEDAPALDLEPDDIIAAGLPFERSERTEEEADFALHWETDEPPLLPESLSDDENDDSLLTPLAPLPAPPRSGRG